MWQSRKTFGKQELNRKPCFYMVASGLNLILHKIKPKCIHRYLEEYYFLLLLCGLPIVAFLAVRRKGNQPGNICNARQSHFSGRNYCMHAEAVTETN